MKGLKCALPPLQPVPSRKKTRSERRHGIRGGYVRRGKRASASHRAAPIRHARAGAGGGAKNRKESPPPRRTHWIMKCAFERECATASPSQVDNVEPERRARPPVGTIGGASTGIPDVPISNVSIPARRNGHRRRPCTRAPRRASAQCGTDAAVGVQTLSARVPAAQMRAIAVPDVWPCGRARARGGPRRYRTPPFDIRDRTIRRNMPHMPRATCIPHVERRRNLAPPCVRYAGEYRSRYRGHDIRGRSPRTHRRSATARPPRSAGYAFERIAERSRQACRSGRSVGAPRARSARLGASSAHPCTPHGPRSPRHDRIDAPRSSSSSRRTLRWQCASFSQ
ncbi:hypothetical protein Y023_1557 [Burkholderia pseudomallei A79D]|nr:hypothetical protein Y023_1557 [Burkholderia pseudomallei A79D]KGY05903.1 hypothetical protein X997_1671 [Burkholderia pseudomallei A79C]